MRSRVHLATRVTLSFEARGSDSGAPVVFLHGVVDSWRSFEPVLDALPASVRAIALTLRGHGDSTQPDDEYGIDGMVADVLAFMDAQQCDAAVIVGHSLGGLVARRLAVAQPTRVLGLVLIGAFVTLHNHPEMQDMARSVSCLSDPIDRGFVRAFQYRMVARSVDADFMTQVVDESLNVPARVWQLRFQSLVAEPSDLKRLGRLRAPTLLVWGDQDRIATRADQDALCSAIDDSRLIVYAGTGHAPHWEEPVRFARHLVAFIYQQRAEAVHTGDETQE